MHPMVLLGDEALVDAHFSPFGDCANLNGCTVCTKCTIRSEIILDAPIELLGDVGHVESRFVLFGNSVSVSAR
jgi:hypothetical protein